MDNTPGQDEFTFSRWIAWTIFAGWSLALVLSFLWAVHMEHRHTEELALMESKALVDKDMMYRKWNALQGGVWADASKVPPNPFLNHILSRRDKTTTDGLHLTLVNPAYMTRMVFDIQRKELDVQARIVSNLPINPDNVSDAWERQALLAAQRGPLETSSVEGRDGQPVFRYLRAMKVEPECMQCHQQQGYKVGDIRGGVSVSVPMAPFLAAANEKLREQGLSLFAIWLLGTLGIAFGYHKVRSLAVLREAADEALHQSRAHFEAVVSSSLDCVVTMDAAGNIMEFNPMAERVFGYRRDEVVGRSMAEVIIPPRFRERHTAGMAHYLSTRQGRVLNQRLELSAIRRDGTEFPVELTITEGDDGGGTPFFTGNLRDISDRRQVEVALREAKSTAESASRAKSEFLANMSHEIRTPMSGVIGMTDVLLNSGLSSEQSKMALLIRDSAQAQLGILNDILDFSKIEAGKMDMSVGPFALREVIEKVCISYSEMAHKKGVTLHQEVDASMPPALEGDALRVRQIIANLTSNAIKFSGGMDQPGEVTVSARLDGEEGGRIWVAVSVQDNGIGMGDDAQQRLFSPFTQADSSTTRRFGGTGLGLVISQRLAVSMGGDIRVASAVNAGSTFTLRLPFAPADEASLEVFAGVSATPLHAVVVPDRESALRDGRLVLVAEDNEVNQEVIRQQLAMLGYQCDIADDGRAAYGKWLACEYGLLLSDIHMPHMDGHLLAEAIRAEEGKTGRRRIPVVALTANVLQGEAERCKASGMDAYLSKPIELMRLKAELDKFLSAGAKGLAPEPPAPVLAPQGGELPLFDPAVLLKTVGDKPAMHQRLFGKYLPNARAKTEQLRLAIAAGDASAVDQIAHALKSSSRAIGAMRLGAHYERLEHAGKAGDVALFQSLLPVFEPVFEATLAEVERRLD